MSDMDDADNWGSWRRHVLLEMEAQRKSLEGLMNALTELKTKEIAEIKTEIALLKYKSSVWGAAGAAFVVLIYFLIEYVKK